LCPEWLSASLWWSYSVPIGHDHPSGEVITAQGDLQHPSSGIICVLSGYRHSSHGVISVLSDYQHPSGVVIMARAQYDLQRSLSGLISVLSVNYHPTSEICITSSTPPSTRGNEKCYYYFYRNPILTRF